MKRLRNQQGLSQREVAEQAEINVRTYRRWEAGESEPRNGKALRSVCNVLRVRPGELDGTEPMEKRRD